MKPVRTNVICKCDLDQKTRHIVPGTDIELYIAKDYDENKRESNPNYGTVVAIPDNKLFKDYDGRKFDQILEPGDYICFQHFQIIDHSGNLTSVLKDQDTGEDLFFVDLREVYFKVKNNKPVLLSNYILCEIEDRYIETDSIIQIPDSAKQKTNTARVAFVSDLVTKVKVGDKIAHMRYADYELEFNGKKYLKMSEDEVFFVIEE